MNLELVFTATTAELVLGEARYPYEPGVAIVSGLAAQWLPAREWRIHEESTDRWAVLVRDDPPTRIVLDATKMRVEVLEAMEHCYRLGDWPPSRAAS